MSSPDAERLETELKFKVSGHDALRDRLRDLGAEPLGRVLETNHIFDDATRSLLRSNRGLRVRTCCDDRGKPIPATLTYKGVPLPGSAKQRVEIETPIGDPQAARDLLAALGFVEVIRFEKRRESWQLGPARIELDELPQLGAYLEIEAPRLQDLDAAAKALQLIEAQRVSATYVALVAQQGASTEATPITLRF